MNAKRRSKYARFDERENVLATLDMPAVVTLLVRNNPILWKWIILAAHDALQGAIVCAIADSTGANVLKEKFAVKLLKWLENTSEEYPKQWMDDFNNLLKRASLAMTPAVKKDVEKFHGLRNEFAHFTPKTWCLEIAGLPRIVGAALHLVEQLMSSDRARLNMSGNKVRRLAARLSGIRAALAIKN